MKKIFMSIVFGLILSAVPIAIYANAGCGSIPGCTLTGSTKDCSDGYCVEICSYRCP